MANIMVATPMYGGSCQGVFLKSLISLFDTLRSKGHGVHFIDLYNESLITRARNTLTEEFLRRPAFTHLLFIDADQGFDPNGILKMIEEDVDIIGAPVPMKGINWERARQAALAGEKDISAHTSVYNTQITDPIEIEKFKSNPNQKIEVERVGTGLVLIKREVFETLKEYVKAYRNGQASLLSIQVGESVYDFWRLEINEYANMLSEDYTFCKMWRDLGNKIYLAPYVQTTHVGMHIFK